MSRDFGNTCGATAGPRANERPAHRGRQVLGYASAKYKFDVPRREVISPVTIVIISCLNDKFWETQNRCLFMGMSIVDEACERFSGEQVKEVVANSTCKSDVVIKLGLRCSGTSARRIIEKLFEAHKPDTTHFDPKAKVRKHKYVTKDCPVCQTPFKTVINHRDERHTCSCKCANTFFRSGDNNGMRQKKLQRIEAGIELDDGYRSICWKHHKRECVICGEQLIVEAHHYNDNHDDNRPENFVPLCPTHHKYWHSRHRFLIEEKVHEYVKSRGVA